MKTAFRATCLFLSCLAFSAPITAQEKDVPLPQQRPGTEAAPGDERAMDLETTNTGVQVLLPKSRPEAETEIEKASPAAEKSDESADETVSEEEPDLATQEKSPAKPARIYQTACPAVLTGDVDAEILPLIDGAGQCGLVSPFLVRGFRIGGDMVKLTSPITVNCQMATELRAWLAQVSAYAHSLYNTKLSSVVTGTSYMCRPRNNQDGSDLSEHGRANALDVVGFVIGDKTRISLPENWEGSSFEARTMRYAHDAACSHFTTVLGPEANALHKDHLHVDLGCHGKTCVYRLCE